MNPSEQQPQTVALPSANSAADIDPQIGAFVARQHMDLHSRESWTRQQVLDHLTASFQASMSPLNEMEQRTWLGLFDSLNTTRNTLDTESRRVIGEFEQNGLRKLRERLKQTSRLDLDPQTTYLHTVYVLDPQVTRSSSSIVKRALDTSAATAVEVATLSLWDAARLNFAFFDFPEVRGRWISHEQNVERTHEHGLLDVDDFIRIVRELNLGADLRQRVEVALAPDAALTRAISAQMHDLFRFNLYDAPRNANNSGVSRELFDTLRDALAPGPAGLKVKVEHVSLKLPDSLLDRVELTIEEAILPLFSLITSPRGWIHLPALLMRVPGVSGLYSYCAERPGGVLRYHVSQAVFEHEFKALLKLDNARGQLGWLISSLSFEQQSQLWPLLDPERKPQGLNWAAGKLYDAYHWVFPVQTLDDLAFAYQHTGQAPQQALSAFYSWRFRVNTEAMAVSKGQQDWRAVKEGFVTVMHQLLDLLLTPVPGGLSGIGRIVTAALGINLVMELVDGIEQAGHGNPQALLQAGLDIGSMLLIGGLHGYAGRLASRRIAGEFERLDKYRMVTTVGATTHLWKNSLVPYARKRLELASAFDDNGLGREGGKLYGQAREQERDLTVELRYDSTLAGYRAVSSDPEVFQPPMAYDPESRRWSVSLDDSRTLSDAQLLERMVALKGGAPEQFRRVLETSGVSRGDLEQVWAGGLPQPALVEALERFEVEQGIAEIGAAREEHSLLPPSAQQVLFGLLPHLSLWPEDVCLRVHDHGGELQRVYGKRQQTGLFSRSVNIRQLAQGGFVEHVEGDGIVAATLAHEAGVVDLILSLLVGDALLDSQGPEARRTWSWWVRRQLGELVLKHSAELFEALGNHSGRSKIDVGTGSSAWSSEVIAYLPVFVSGIPQAVSTLRLLYPHLSLPRLTRFLRDNPLSSSQVRDLLELRRVPYRLRYSLDREQQFSALGRVLDGIRQVRSFHEPTDAWLQCIVGDFLRHRLGKGLRWVEGDAAALSRADQLSLRRYGQGTYTTLQSRRQPSVDLSVPSQSFYLALAASLSTREQRLLGMTGAKDIQALRNGFATYLLTLRREDGSLGLRLEQYERQLPVSPPTVPGLSGLHTLDRRWLVRLGKSFHEVEWDGRFNEWRGRHPELMGAYAPLLEHNGRGGWWHELEQPWTWGAERALQRLTAEGLALSDEVARQILTVSGVPDSLPGRLLFENQAPVPLLDEVSRHFIQAGAPVADYTNVRLVPLAKVLRQHFPSLSQALAQAVLEQASSSDWRLIRESQRLPLAVVEQARYLSDEIDVCRLYESLCLPTERTDLNDTLLLQLLDRLPGWEPGLRIELRRDTAAGSLIASVGDAVATTRRVLVKGDAGYEPFALDSTGARSLAAAHEDPFGAVLLALPQLRRTTLGIPHAGEAVEQDLKRVMFQSVMADRNRLRHLLGQSALMPWSRLPQRLLRLSGGALGYPLSGRGSVGGHPPGLLKKLRLLYRGCTDAQLLNILADLGSTPEARAQAVARLQAEYRQLKQDLSDWSGGPAELLFSSIQEISRREVVLRILRCWRRQSTGEESEPLSYVLVLDGLEAEDLPELNADFSHVTLLSMNDMGLREGPYLSQFLRGFTGLTTLSIERSDLNSLPSAIAQLQRLQVLSLEHNLVQLNEGTVRELEGLQALTRLNLNGNPLDVLPNFSTLQRLQVLQLSQTEISEWPQGLLELRELVRLELGMNAISDLPVQLFSGHDQLCQGTDLSGNPLSSQALSAILGYRKDHGLHLNFGVEGLSSASRSGIDRWAQGSEKTPQRVRHWQLIRKLPNADVFFLLFERMSSPSTFFNTHYKAARNDLCARVWRLLSIASPSKSLCSSLFKIEEQWRYSGEDNYQIFNRLEFAVNSHGAQTLEPSAMAESRLLTLLRGQFRMDAMWFAVERLHPEQSIFWYRAYYDALVRELALPDQFNGLFSPSPARVNPQQIAEMRRRVLGRELTAPAPQTPVADPDRALLNEVLNELPEEVPPEPPEVLPEQLPLEPEWNSPEDDSSPLIRFLVANDVWSNFLIRAHDADFQRVFGQLLAFDNHPQDSEYRLLWRTRMSQFQYNGRRTRWLRYWTIRALLKKGVPALGGT